MVGFVIWIVGLILTIKAAFGDRTSLCTLGKEVIGYCTDSSYQLDRIVFLLFLC